MGMSKETRLESLELDAVDCGLFIDSGPSEYPKRYRVFIRSKEYQNFYSGKHIFEGKGIKETEIFIEGYMLAVSEARDNSKRFENCNLYQIK